MKIVWRELKALPAEIWVLAAATLVNRMGTMALPFLVLYLTSQLGYDAGTAGMVLGLYGFGALVAGPFTGWLCDRVGATRLMIFSLFSSGLILLFYPFVDSLPAVIAITVSLALTGEAFRPAVWAATSRAAPLENRKSAFALNRLAVNLGMSVGPAVGGLLLSRSYSALFWVDGVTTLLAGIVLAAFLAARGDSRGPAKTASDAPGIGALLEAMRDRKLQYAFFAFIPVWFVFFQHESTLGLYLTETLGLEATKYGLLFTINTILIIFLEFPLNVYTAHWPYRVTLPLGSTLFAVGFGALAFVDGYFGVALTVVIWTFGEMILVPSAAAYFSEIAPPNRTGSYVGIFASSFNLAFVLGPTIGTLIFSRIGPLALWVTCFGLAALSALLMRGMSPEIKPPAAL